MSDRPDTEPTFEYEWTCARSDATPWGVASHPRLVLAMSRAGEAFMHDVGAPYHELPDRYGVNVPLVAVDVAYESPVSVGETLRISVAAELGRTSIELQFIAVSGDDEVAFRGHERHVCVDLADDGSTPIPDGLREAIERRSDS